MNINTNENLEQLDKTTYLLKEPLYRKLPTRAGS